ncbi:MAG: toll/interleukin-1 receptor domain-containing protein [Deltaproteobacteria bacterium]|nr:toll/interleukin-1 receptor domain-containing protein [Deltaproteobacteria bacterium]
MSTIQNDYKYDVFISYAHLDNQPLVPGEKGWVSELHEILDIRLSMLKGQKANIWRDKRLRKNEIFDDTIAEAVGAAKLFLSVVTPRYIRSEYCQRELMAFSRHNATSTGDRSRIFKVLKTPVPIDEHPDPMKNVLGYEFFNYDEETRHAHEFSIDSKSYREQYLSRLDDLAQEIQECLVLMAQSDTLPTPALLMKSAGFEPMSPPHDERSSEKETVYVCSTSSDVRIVHDQIRRELAERGVPVIPDHPFALETNTFKNEVRDALKGADLSVHIIGERYGIIPEDESLSVVEIQNQIASMVCRETPLNRIIWIPEDVAPTDERQSRFIEALMRDPDAQRNAELVVGTVEDLKGDILEKLEEIEQQKKHRRLLPGQATSVPPLTSAPPAWIYLIKGPYDAGEVDTLEDCLWNAGLEVLTLSFDESLSELELSEEHQMNLRQADICMVYYGQSPERWVRKQLCDIRKSGGMKRDKPMLATSVYIGSNGNTRQKKFRSNSATVIWPNGAETAEAVKSFLTVVEESRCAS